MKKAVSFCLLFFCLRLAAQESLTYTQLLENTAEINLHDSLFVSNLTGNMNPVDTITVKRWFAPVLAATSTIKLKNRNFYLAGKITGNDNFDLHILVEDKRKADSSVMQVMHFVTTKKDGSYIASFKAVVKGSKKKSNYYMSSWLYKGLSIVQDSRITTANTSLADITRYKINTTGRFIMYSY